MDQVVFNLYIQIISMIYIITTLFIYSHQRKIITIENKIFNEIVIINPIVLLVGIINNTIGTFSIIEYLYYIILSYWFFLFNYYLLIINSRNHIELIPLKENPNLIEYNKIKKYLYILYIIFILVILITGLPVLCTKVLILLSLIYWIYTAIDNTINHQKRKTIYITLSIIINIISLVIEYLYPDLNLLSATISFITIILYFTLENPDIKLIEELNIATARAEKANNDKTKFLIDMYNEIKNPLNAIYGFSSALKEENINKNTLHEIESIYTESHRLINIINKLLDISNIEAGTIKINNNEYDSKKLFNSLATLGSVRLSGKNVKFIYQLDKDIPPVLYGDSNKLKQIIMNIITNATRYTDEGFVSFTIKTSIENDNCILTIMVDDSGKGIDEEEQENIFTTYNHVHLSAALNDLGTGLGLALTKKMLEAMGGTLLLVSAPNRGSKFTLVINQKISNKTIEEIENNVPHVPIIFDASINKVLIVDDNKINQKVTKHLLRDYQIEADMVSSGYECINKIKKDNNYDIIFLDEVMPHLSGTDTLKQLIKIPGFNSIVISLTANNSPGVKEYFQKLGYNDFLEKPIDKYELYLILKKYAKNNRNNREELIYKI